MTKELKPKDGRGGPNRGQGAKPGNKNARKPEGKKRVKCSFTLPQEALDEIRWWAEKWEVSQSMALEKIIKGFT